jgi:hypothetical protein
MIIEKMKLKLDKSNFKLSIEKPLQLKDGALIKQTWEISPEARQAAQNLSFNSTKKELRKSNEFKLFERFQKSGKRILKIAKVPSFKGILDEVREELSNSKTNN